MRANLSGHLAPAEGGRPNSGVSAIVWNLLGRERETRGISRIGRLRWIEHSLEKKWREGPPGAGRHPLFSHLCCREAQRQAQERLFMCMCVCFRHAWAMCRWGLFVCGCVLYTINGNLPVHNVVLGFSHQKWQSSLFAWCKADGLIACITNMFNGISVEIWNLKDVN